MLVFAVITLFSKTWINEKGNITLPVGFYEIEMIGARGGSTSISKYGQPAKLRGVIAIDNEANVSVIAGSFPGQGTLGEGGLGYDSIHGGGGYSAIYVNDALYAMAGGGSGSAYYLIDLSGLPAGGIGYTYDASYQKINKTDDNSNHMGGHQNCFGGRPAKCSGGGGGYYGGDGGHGTHPQGQGGTSYMYNILDNTILDGREAITTDFKIYHEALNAKNGIVHIEAKVVECAAGCSMCDYYFRNNCTRCNDGKFLYRQTGRNWTCLNSCSQIGQPSFSRDGECFECPTGCFACSSNEVCQTCKEDYHMEGSQCILGQLPVISTSGSSTTTTTEIDDDNDASKINKDLISGSGNGQSVIINDRPTKRGDEGFKWWIIVVAVGCVALVVVTIIIIIYMKRSKDESIEMIEENVVDAKTNTTNTVTVENSLYADSVHTDEDPFKHDFDEDQDESGVFHANDADSVDEDIEIDT